jgi:hypothetical protein
MYFKNSRKDTAFYDRPKDIGRKVVPLYSVLKKKRHYEESDWIRNANL